MATKLQVYNHALLLMKERRLASLTEDRESRRILDEFYDQVLQFCIEQGMWKWAMKRDSLTQQGSGLYGFTYRFDKPSDFIHLFSASEASDFDPPLVYNFVDEGAFFYANSTPLYIRYTSNATNRGLDLARWPQGFTEFVCSELASWAAFSITGDPRIAQFLEQRAKVKMANALSLHALTALPGHLPMNAEARAPVASEEVHFRPELLPFGTEVKALIAGQQQRREGDR